MSGFNDRERLSEEDAKSLILNSQSNMILHLVKNEDDSFSIVGHIVCEFCDYCETQGDCRGRADITPELAKENIYENQF